MRLRQGDFLPGVTSMLVSDVEHSAESVATDNGVVVLTQCCDLARSPEWVHIAPVVELSAGQAGDAKAGRSSRWADAEWEGVERYVDLSLISTVRLEGLVGATATRVPLSSSEDRQIFAAKLSRRYSRFAYPDSVVDSLKPVKEYIRKRGRNELSDIGRVLDRVATLRLEVDGPWEQECGLHANLLVVVEDRFLPTIPDNHSFDLSDRSAPIAEVAKRILETEVTEPAVHDVWFEFGEALLSKIAQGTGSVSEFSVEVMRASEFSFARFLRSADLDLDDISDRI